MHIFLREVLEQALMGKTLILCIRERGVSQGVRAGGTRRKTHKGEDRGKGKGDWIKGRRGEALASLMEVFLPH